MEFKNGIVSINRKEMLAIKKMDHHQIEGQLQAVYMQGQKEGEV